MALFRFYTENAPEMKANVINSALTVWPEGFTVTEGQGVWKGGQESTLILEVAQDDTPDNRWISRVFAEGIKKMNHQQAVLLQVLQNTMEFV